MKNKISAAVLIFTVTALGACGEPPKVVQGTVVSYEPGTKQMVVKDELAPNAQVSFALDKADIGAEPQQGDTVRLSYRPSGDKNSAIRVMNITRQAELKGGKSSH